MAQSRPVDTEALSGAPLAALAHEAGDEAEAIRAYIARERPHLLSCYEMDKLVELVRAQRAADADHPAALEHYRPV